MKTRKMMAYLLDGPPAGLLPKDLACVLFDAAPRVLVATMEMELNGLQMSGYVVDRWFEAAKLFVIRYDEKDDETLLEKIIPVGSRVVAYDIMEDKMIYPETGPLPSVIGSAEISIHEWDSARRAIWEDYGCQARYLREIWNDKSVPEEAANRRILEHRMERLTRCYKHILEKIR